MTKQVYCDKPKVTKEVYCSKPGDEVNEMDMELGTVQEKFADIVWAHEPVGSGELVKLCEKELKWKKPTTYTVLRKLCEKGIFQNVDGIVTSLVSREEFYSAKSVQVVEDSYAGSLPAFVVAFLSRKELTREEADEIQKMIDSFRSDLSSEREDGK